MDHKVCSDCKESLPLDRFPFRNKKTGRRSGRCKACTSLYKKRWKESLSEEHLARITEAEKECRKRIAERHKEQYLKSHGGVWPKCECGCGQEVKFVGDSRYSSTGHTRLLRGHCNKKLGDKIPNEKLRDVLLKMKKERGWSNTELARRAGISQGTLHGILYRKDRIGHDREFVENMFRRLAGLAAPPSKHQLNQMAKERPIQLPDGSWARATPVKGVANR